MARNLYLVTSMSRKLKVKIDIPAYPENYKSVEEVACNWHDGQVGVMPVFSVKRKAERYARKHGYQVIALEVPKP
jgi:hypothetical protein